MALPENGPEAGVLWGLRISAKVILSPPELLVMVELNDAPGFICVLPRNSAVPKFELLMASTPELKLADEPLKVIFTGRVKPGSEHE